MYTIAFCCLLAFFLSLGIAHYYRRIALSFKIVDRPNDRSSHRRPIPRGAGVSFFLSMNICFIILSAFGELSSNYTLALFLGGPVVMVMGYLDDVRSVGPLLRLAVHFFVAIFVFYLLSDGFKEPVRISFLPMIPWLTGLFCILFIAWFINLYNFMDGCDGLAAGVGMIAAGLIGVVSYYNGYQELAVIYFVTAYALTGFLMFNWEPARVFMGDSGAYYLGYLFGSLALVSKIYYESSLYIHLMMFGMLIVDATWTLIRRFLRLEKVYRPHRLHGFQKLLDRGWSHAKVSSLYILITCLWLFPITLISTHFKAYSFSFLVIAYVPIFLFILFIKAGSRNGT